MEGNDKFAVETAIASMERTIRRLWILAIILAVMLFSSNAAWIYYESQWVDETTTYEADSENGGNAIINGSGEVTIHGEG